MKALLFSFLGLLMTSKALSQSFPSRRDLLTAVLSPQLVSKVQVKEVILAPAQRAPLHQHPCPVVGYVTQGTLLYQVQGQSPRLLKKGDAFYEPAYTAVAHFDNESTSEPLTFIAFYLTQGEANLIELLPQKP